MNITSKVGNLSGLLILIIMLVACSGSRINDSGHAESVIWPKENANKMNHSDGVFVNEDNLKLIRVGMTKDQLYQLIGRPHYNELFIKVREWDYLFNFYRDPESASSTVYKCQFKVIYDKNYITREFYWKALGENAGYCPPLKKPSKNNNKKMKAISIQSEYLFNFDKREINADGERKLIEIANYLKEFCAQGCDQNSINISGYTDWLGSEHYNQILSKDRADAVKDFFVRQGLTENIFSTHGYGASQQIKSCNSKLKDNALIECLRENRRVLIRMKKS